MDYLQRQIPQRTYAWVVVFASCLMMGMAFGLMIGITVFLKPLEAEFGWQRGVTSFAYSCGSFSTGLVGILMGRLVDRISPRPILITGALMLGTGHLLLSQVEATWQLYLLYGLFVGGLGNGCLLIPLLANVGLWFDKHKGIAIGIVMAGQSLGGAVMPSVTRALVESMPWRDAYLVLGLGAWAILLPLALLVRPAPGVAQLRADSLQAVPPAGALAPGRLTTVLCVAIVCCCVCMSIPVVHVYPLTVEAGFSPAQASAVLGLLMAVSIVGRVGAGRLSDAVGGLRALLLASGVQTITIYWFAQMATLPGLLGIAVLFGLGYGGVIPSYAVVIRELIPAHRIGASLGIVLFFGNLGMSLGGYLGGLLYDLSGGYPTSFSTGALAGVANLVIVGGLLTVMRAKRPVAAQPA